jgi:hypothetical protein
MAGEDEEEVTNQSKDEAKPNLQGGTGWLTRSLILLLLPLARHHLLTLRGAAACRYQAAGG